MNTINNNVAVYCSGPTFVAADYLRLSFVLSTDYTANYATEHTFGGSMQKPTTSKGHSHCARPQVNDAVVSTT